MYNMDETGVLLSMLGSLKVLISKDKPRAYRGASVKRTMGRRLVTVKFQKIVVNSYLS